MMQMNSGRKKGGFKKIDQLMVNFDQPEKNKYVSREYQSYGVELAYALGDEAHKSLYIKMARDYPRGLLETARSFVKDAASAQSKARLFMWKLKQLRDETKKKEIK